MNPHIYNLIFFNEDKKVIQMTFFQEITLEHWMSICKVVNLENARSFTEKTKIGKQIQI